ncbi:glycoside hydrolase [Dyadobacter frigoris]|uniref:Beta-glycosidase n=1 Tax=Dyadobacter frigoris TaxID=2576211 RepID=A0A4U6DA36_9BACT|nr:glycoside hydrolase [Dyadobacter frigoris]TKT93241.1 beta-glycosidase [Dyadobacter frigoris]
MMKIAFTVLAGFVFVFAFDLKSFAQATEGPIIFKIDTKNKAQVIENFGAAGCWFSEGIGKYWPEQKKEQIAEWLFSKSFDNKGNPKGIGLSAWRFNIGGGTAEQGDSSGIKDFRKRVESFQNPDESYDWNKQAGYVWFVKKAKSYGVENLIAFSNTPPVQFTQNGRGFKTEKDYKSNLKPDKYGAYAGFLADVIKHFDAENLHFNYISPVNEPQWDWSNKPGQASQEGTSWKNEEIYKVTTALDSALTAQKLSSKIMLVEAGMLNYLYAGSGNTNRQIQSFFGKESKLKVRNLKHTSDFIGGHSYFTENGDSSLIKIRKNVADTTRKYDVKFWQTEYSMLADGFREGTKEKRSAIDCALFLAKVIHNDLVVGNASAWQLWNSYEPGSPDYDTRYFLIALKPNEKHTDGEYFQTKGLWAFGNFSRFIRPGMQRLIVDRSDKISDLKAAQNVMLSAYTDAKGKVIVVAINYTTLEKRVKIDLANAGKSSNLKKYITSASEGDNLKPYPVQKLKDEVILPARSVVTMVVE